MKKNVLSALAAALVCSIGAMASAQPVQLLISEALADCKNPETNTDSSEFLEIFNPTGSPVDLSDYYISDTQFYWTMTTAVDNKLNTGPTDHLLRFPAGTVIPANGIAVVTQRADRLIGDYFGGDASAFFNLPGSPILLQVGEITGTTPAGVQRMINLNTNVTADGQENFSFTNAAAAGGEFKVLFYWDGNPANNVVDIDIVAWGGTPVASWGTQSNVFAPKTAINAPTYNAEAGTHDNLTVGLGSVFYRISEVQNGENTSGGNGIGGRDQSTEINSATAPGSSWRGLALSDAANVRNTNANLAEPTGPTPGESPLQFSAASDWNLFH